MKSHYYSAHAGGLRVELGQAISREQMRQFHAKKPARHLLVAARQFAILGLATWALIHLFLGTGEYRELRDGSTARTVVMAKSLEP